MQTKLGDQSRDIRAAAPSPVVPLRVAVYNASERYSGYATGVGRHVNNMVGALARQEESTVQYYVPRDYWRLDQTNCRSSVLYDVPSFRLPLSRRAYMLMELASIPAADLSLQDVDWVYSPREAFIFTRRAKRAITVHDVYSFEPARFQDGKSKFDFRLWSKAILEADLVLTVSNFSKSRICEIFGADPARIEVVGNGVEQCFFDIAAFDPDAVSPLPKQRYFVSIGGVIQKKGGARLLEFARLLASRGEGLSLVVIGPVAPEFTSLVSSMPALKVLDRGIDDAMMQRWIRGASALVALSEYEGFGIPCLEAMAARVPVISSMDASLPEIVGDAGIVVNANSSTQLDDAIEIWRDNTLRDVLIERGHKRAAEFRWDKCVAKLVAGLSQRHVPPQLHAHGAAHNGSGC